MYVGRKVARRCTDPAIQSTSVSQMAAQAHASRAEPAIAVGQRKE